MIESDFSEDAQLSIRFFVDDLMYGPTTRPALMQFISNMCADYSLSSDENSVSDNNCSADVEEAKEWLCSSHGEVVQYSLDSPINEYDRLAVVWSASEAAALSPIANIIDNNWGDNGLAGLLASELDELQKSPQYSALGEEARDWVDSVKNVVEGHRRSLTAEVHDLFALDQ